MFQKFLVWIFDTLFCPQTVYSFERCQHCKGHRTVEIDIEVLNERLNIPIPCPSCNEHGIVLLEV